MARNIVQYLTYNTLAPGLLGMLIMWANMFVGSGRIVWQERGILKRLGATALRPFELVSAQVAAHLLFSLIQAALLVAIAMSAGATGRRDKRKTSRSSS